MLFDGPDTWLAFADHTAAGGSDVVGAGDTDPCVAFAGRLAAACGRPGPLWRERGAAAGAGRDAAGYTLLVCGGGSLSPYAALRDLSACGDVPPGPVACLTLAGGALQGQHGRGWQALAGNLHLSVAVPCDLDAAACAPSLPMLPAVAACEAVEALAGTSAAAGAGLGIKWVNDVVLAAGKLGGALTAARTQGGRVTVVFAGLGLNLAQAPALATDPFALPAVALATLGPPPALPTAAAVVLDKLQRRLATLAVDGPGSLVEAYRERSVVLGREVAIWPTAERARWAAEPAGGASDAPALAPSLPEPARRGRVAGIEPDLSLRLAGQAEPVRDGCLRLVGPATARPLPPR